MVLGVMMLFDGGLLALGNVNFVLFNHSLDLVFGGNFSAHGKEKIGYVLSKAQVAWNCCIFCRCGLDISKVP